MLAVQSRPAEAIREAERACELDPFCLVVSVSGALVHYLSSDYNAAIERCLRIIDLGPEYLPARRLLGAAYLQAGRAREALEALEADSAGAAEWLDRWRKLDRSRYLPPYHLALAHAGLGEVDEAFVALERAAVERDPAFAYVAVEPRFEPLRGDPRYAPLVRQLGL